MVADRRPAAMSYGLFHVYVLDQTPESSAQRRCGCQSQQMFSGVLPPEGLRQFSELPFIGVAEMAQGIGKQAQEGADKRCLQGDDRTQAQDLWVVFATEGDGEPTCMSLIPALRRQETVCP